MKNALIYTALPLNNATSVLHDDLIEVIRLIRYHKHDVTIIFNSKKVLKYYLEVLDETGCRSSVVKPLLDMKDDSHIFKHDNSWLDDLDSHYDTFLTWGLLASTVLHVTKTLKLLHETGQFKIIFMSSMMHINPFIIVDDILLKFPGLKLHCKVTDYNEPDMHLIYSDATMLGLYDDLTKGYKKVHDTEYCNFKDGFKDTTKVQDFVFGYTVTFAARKYLSDFVTKNISESDTIKLFLKDNYWKDGKRNNLISHSLYCDELAKSRYTLIAPSTVVTEFSMERFNEALVRKCLPIFMEEVRCEHALDDDVCAFIRDNLTYRTSLFSSVEDFIATHDYDELCRKLYALNSIKKHMDANMLEKQVLEEIGL